MAQIPNLWTCLCIFWSEQAWADSDVSVRRSQTFKWLCKLDTMRWMTQMLNRTRLLMLLVNYCSTWSEVFQFFNALLLLLLFFFWSRNILRLWHILDYCWLTKHNTFVGVMNGGSERISQKHLQATFIYFLIKNALG